MFDFTFHTAVHHHIMNLSHIHECNKRSHEIKEVEEKVHLFAEWIPAACKDLVM